MYQQKNCRQETCLSFHFSSYQDREKGKRDGSSMSHRGRKNNDIAELINPQNFFRTSKCPSVAVITMNPDTKNITLNTMQVKWA